MLCLRGKLRSGISVVLLLTSVVLLLTVRWISLRGSVLLSTCALVIVPEGRLVLLAVPHLITSVPLSHITIFYSLTNRLLIVPSILVLRWNVHSLGDLLGVLLVVKSVFLSGFTVAKVVADVGVAKGTLGD